MVVWLEVKVLLVELDPLDNVVVTVPIEIVWTVWVEVVVVKLAVTDQVTEEVGGDKDNVPLIVVNVVVILGRGNVVVVL